MLEAELTHDESSFLSGVSIIETVDEVHSVADPRHSYLANFEAVEGFSQRDHRLQAEEPLVVLSHGHGVIDGD